jgi:hypothetical protein
MYVLGRWWRFWGIVTVLGYGDGFGYWPLPGSHEAETGDEVVRR